MAEIMPEMDFEDDDFAVSLKQKKNKLRRKLRNLKTRMQCLKASINKRQDSGEDVEDTAEGKVLCEKLCEVEDMIRDIQFCLACGEAYSILSADFPVHEDIFPR